MPTACYKSADRDFTLLKGDCVELMDSFDFKFDMIFADPPYHLSNGGISVQNGKMVSVNKGEWDKSNGYDDDYAFDKSWISACRNKLKSNGTIWISGTYHNIFTVARCLTELGFKILNCITWEKTNPPPNLSCRYFTYSAEYILWARKEYKTPHYFNYELMKRINGGTQMRDVWRLPAIGQWEKTCGKHPTQKPLGVLARIILASTQPGAWVLDPFAGSSTTGIAANLLGRRFLGMEREDEFIEMGISRREELNNPEKRRLYKGKLKVLPTLSEHMADVLLGEPAATPTGRICHSDDVRKYTMGGVSRFLRMSICEFLRIEVKDRAAAPLVAHRRRDIH